MPTSNPQIPNLPPFIFVCCQRGFEATVKDELQRDHPDLSLAFSRPGFLTFKQTGSRLLPAKFNLASTFSRCYGWSVGQAIGTDGKTLIDTVANCDAAARCQHLHVWERDRAVPGERGFEPGETELSRAVADQLAQHPVFQRTDRKVQINRMAAVDDLVLDVIIVSPNQWWFGFHYATTIAARWPGGVPFFDPQQDVISRAYFKLKEALLWSGIKIRSGDRCAEIGSAPGGACQLLLELDAQVIGVDPAEMDDDILADERFTHIRRRGSEVRKRDLKDVKWLLADLNVAPTYTLDTVTEIVSSDSVDVKGIVLTLKMSDAELAKGVAQVRERVKKLGFSVIKTRQLSYNRSEYCLVAVKDKFVLRAGRKRQKSRQRPENRQKSNDSSTQ